VIDGAHVLIAVSELERTVELVQRRSYKRQLELIARSFEDQRSALAREPEGKRGREVLVQHVSAMFSTVGIGGRYTYLGTFPNYSPLC
jgi:hypothetical protein